MNQCYYHYRALEDNEDFKAKFVIVIPDDPANFEAWFKLDDSLYRVLFLKVVEPGQSTTTTMRRTVST